MIAPAQDSQLDVRAATEAICCLWFAANGGPSERIAISRDVRPLSARWLT